ncbi:AMP-binding protein [Methylobacillus gramineus]|uniref:AMP-binding protein n=1 Tax=Methylobacillus gramineus TaxID=755169 RepID=UPI001CFF6995|nr:AMP-binding protein [Methylobacillus gramineus]MCB5184317.1 AMP-binding protein [Methylobacillus gramineus]
MANDTLPHWLIHHASIQPKRVALRHKHLGIWHEQSWKSLRSEIGQLVDILDKLGFGRGDTLVLLTHPRREALLLSLAAQWLGGIAAPLDPSLEDDHVALLLRYLNPVFVFAEGQRQVDQTLANSRQDVNVIYAEDRGLSAYPQTALQHYAELLRITPAASRAPVAEAGQSAFALYRVNGERNVQVEHFHHDELLEEGRHLVFAERLSQHEEALAARVFAASGHLRYLLSPWLTAGFTLNFPENIATRDADRRELGPTLVAGTRETYQRLESLVRERLPVPNSLTGRLVTYALRADGDVFQRFLGYWLVKRPLRDVIGFSRIRVPLLIGPALPVDSLQFFKTLGIHIRTWDKVANWRTLSTTTSRQLPSVHDTDVEADNITKAS